MENDNTARKGTRPAPSTPEELPAPVGAWFGTAAAEKIAETAAQCGVKIGPLPHRASRYWFGRLDTGAGVFATWYGYHKGEPFFFLYDFDPNRVAFWGLGSQSAPLTHRKLRKITKAKQAKSA